MKNPIFVALDVDDQDKALRIASEVRPYVGGFKLGPRLLIKYGPEMIHKLSEWGEVFVDNKYNDIPSTVVSAVKATFEQGASFTTVHASCGPLALKELANLEVELNKTRFFRILAVSVLTSFEISHLPANWVDSSILDQVLKLSQQVYESGLRGLVCSGAEISQIKSKFTDMECVVPGIRLTDNQVHDQKRVLTPSEALKRGASYLVIGRPIIEASQPVEAARKIFESLG